MFVLRNNPYTLNWGYKLRTSETETYGGKVVQILGVEINSPITIVGEAGSGGFEELRRMAAYVDRCMAVTNKQHTKFVFAEEDWEIEGWFEGFPRNYVDLKTISPGWQIPFHIDQESGQLAARAISEEMKKLRDGVGWEPENIYRFPVQNEKDNELNRALGIWEKVLQKSENYYDQYAFDYYGTNPEQDILLGIVKEAIGDVETAVSNTTVSNYGPPPEVPGTGQSASGQSH